MSILLTLTHLHPALPALAAGASVALTRCDDGSYTVTVPGHGPLIARLAAACRDGALILTDPSEPGLKELRDTITADRDRLLLRMEELGRQPAPGERTG